MSKIRIYRPYQVNIHSFLKNTTGSLGVEAPTGCGKTTQIVGYVGFAKKKKLWEKILIATTQQQIEESIIHRDFEIVKIGREVVQVPNDLIATARGRSHGTRNEVAGFLTGLKLAMACTHATLAGLDKGKLPKNLKGHLLIVDEGHHLPADGLSKFEKIWIEHGGTVFIFTATGYRSDGRKVGSEDTKWFIRSMAQHMEEGYAPKNLKYNVIAIKGKKKVSHGQFTGMRSPPKTFVDDIAQTAVNEWKRLGKPKTIVQIPPVSGGSATIVKKIIRAFQKENQRVVDATGTDLKKKSNFLSFIRRESKIHWKDSEADIVVGCQRVVEGTDWPACESIIRVGIPGSVTMIVQLTGRAMRKKDKSCPKKRRNLSNMVFLVPTGDGEVMRKMSLDHSRAVLMLSCFMADSQTGQKWLLEKELRKFKRRVEPDDGSDRSMIIAQMSSVRRQAMNEGCKITIGELVKETRKKCPNADLDTIKTIALETMNKQDGGKRIRTAVKKINGNAKNTQIILDELINEFRDVTLDGPSDSMELLGHQVHALTGGDIIEWANRVSESLPLSESQILRWADEHYGRTGKWPTAKNGGDVHETTNSWKAIDAALRGGYRGLPGGKSLDELINEERKNGKRNNLTEDQILNWAKDWFQQTGKYPRDKPRLASDIIPGTYEKWSNISQCLRLGLRGLPGGSSLKQLLVKHGLSNLLDEKTIILWAREWIRENGKPPSTISHQIIPGTNEKWININSTLKNGHRGLPGKYGLKQLLDKHGLYTPKTLDEKMIILWAKEWIRENGKPPSAIKQIIPGTNDTWANIDGILRKGSRGLPKSNGLSKFLKKHGLRSKNESQALKTMID